MKKIMFMVITSLIAISLVACGGKTNEENQTPSKEADVEQNETNANTETETEVEAMLKEPEADTKCAYCDMTVYMRDHEMGMFSTQAITKDGENLFFDDAGCMLNYERMENLDYDQYVRDFNTLDWVKAEDAVLVKADLKTPMNYGYLFFKDEASANEYVEKNSDIGAAIATWEDLDSIAAERHKMKMEKMQSGEMGGHEMTDDGHEGHEGHGH